MFLCTIILISKPFIFLFHYLILQTTRRLSIGKFPMSSELRVSRQLKTLQQNQNRKKIMSYEDRINAVAVTIKPLKSLVCLGIQINDSLAKSRALHRDRYKALLSFLSGLITLITLIKNLAFFRGSKDNPKPFIPKV